MKSLNIYLAIALLLALTCVAAALQKSLLQQLKDMKKEEVPFRSPVIHPFASASELRYEGSRDPLKTFSTKDYLLGYSDIEHMKQSKKAANYAKSLLLGDKRNYHQFSRDIELKDPKTKEQILLKYNSKYVSGVVNLDDEPTIIKVRCYGEDFVDLYVSNTSASSNIPFSVKALFNQIIPLKEQSTSLINNGTSLIYYVDEGVMSQLKEGMQIEVEGLEDSNFKLYVGLPNEISLFNNFATILFENSSINSTASLTFSFGSPLITYTTDQQQSSFYFGISTQLLNIFSVEVSPLMPTNVSLAVSVPGNSISSELIANSGFKLLIELSGTYNQWSPYLVYSSNVNSSFTTILATALIMQLVSNNMNLTSGWNNVVIPNLVSNYGAGTPSTFFMKTPTQIGIQIPPMPNYYLEEGSSEEISLISVNNQFLSPPDNSTIYITNSIVIVGTQGSISNIESSSLHTSSSQNIKHPGKESVTNSSARLLLPLLITVYVCMIFNLI